MKIESELPLLHKFRWPHTVRPQAFPASDNVFFMSHGLEVKAGSLFFMDNCVQRKHDISPCGKEHLQF